MSRTATIAGALLGLISPGMALASEVSPAVAERVRSLGEQIDKLKLEQQELATAAGIAAEPLSRLSVFHGYIGVAVVAFLVTVCTTPLMRRLAVANGIVDMPSDPRKVHRMPVAYMGGVAVYLGLVAGIVFSYIAYQMPGLIGFHQTEHGMAETLYRPSPVPVSIVLGMSVIMLVGLLDDIVGIPPWQKVGGQLFAAAALAYEDVGVKVASGLLVPVAGWFGLDDLTFMIPMPGAMEPIGLDLVYWSGTAIIAVFVLGGCNASNLIDGLDGLLTGVTAIAAAGLLIVALSLCVLDDGPLDGQRVVLCLALIGACLGFLPHNFNPASIFLGDCGSLLLGFSTIVIVLTLGDTGKTHLVAAGLFIYAIPIIDTVLAIVRRKLSKKSISEADDQHLHHMLKRSFGVKGAVFSLYGIGLACAALGVAMSLSRARVSYAAGLVLAAFIGVTAIKIARRKHLEDDARARLERRLALQARGRDTDTPPAEPVPSAAAAKPVDAAPGSAAG